MAAIFLLLLLLRLAAANVPAIYIFGDSLSDPGNNKFLLTTAQADFFPNGIDYPDGATGRFCNGLTAADIIAQELGLPVTPAYHDPKTRGNVILKGVSYASGGAKITNRSGSFLQNVEPLAKQLANFARTKEELVSLLQGEVAAEKHVSESLFFSGIGSNDYLDYVTNPRGKTPQEFEDELVTTYRRYLIKAYEMGARKIAVIGLGPFGCIPNQRIGNFLGANGKACKEKANEMAVNANKALKAMVLSLNQQLSGVKMIFGTTYFLYLDVNSNPGKYGFVNANSACCGISPLRLIACAPGGSVCSSRSRWVYWDAYHPSEASNKLVAKALMDGDTGIIFPMNIRQLAGSS